MGSKALKARASITGAVFGLQVRVSNDRRATTRDNRVRLRGMATPEGRTLDVAVGWNKLTRRVVE